MAYAKDTSAPIGIVFQDYRRIIELKVDIDTSDVDISDDAEYVLMLNGRIVRRYNRWSIQRALGIPREGRNYDA